MMKKQAKILCSMLLAALLCVSAAPLTAFAEDSAQSGVGSLSGMGSKDHPFQIGSYDELLQFAAIVNEEDNTVNAVLAADIDASASAQEGHEWTPIGTGQNCFQGRFDGQNHSVKSLKYTNAGSAPAGLFGVIGSDGIVESVVLEECLIQSNTNYVGGIAGISDGTVKNCKVMSIIRSEASYVGGIAGSSDGTITDCSNVNAVSGQGNCVGGIAGTGDGSVTNCYNNGTVSCGGENAGGIGGRIGSGITNCYNTGHVTGTSIFVGGITGYCLSTIENCRNTGPVIGGAEYVGGIAGSCEETVSDCNNEGSVSGSRSFLGGIAGIIAVIRAISKAPAIIAAAFREESTWMQCTASTKAILPAMM